MPRFLSQAVEDLNRQLSFAPPEQRHRYVERIERLYWEVDAEANYPMEYVVYRITRTRPRLTGGDITLVGVAVRKDLMTLFENISDTLDQSASDFNPPPLDLPALSKRLNVTTKTLSRYRQQGLFARRLAWGSGRKRLGVLPGSLDRFLASRRGRLRKAARFSRLDEDTRHRIITRARRIASRRRTSPFAMAQHLAPKFDRSVEAVRQLLVAHDCKDPRVAIFPDYLPPLSEGNKTAAFRAWRRAVPVARLADRFGRARNAIYRLVHIQRHRWLRTRRLAYVKGPTFELPEADEVILGPPLPEPTQPARRSRRARDTGPTLDADQQTILLVRYNYLKYKAATFSAALPIDPDVPPGELDRIETLMRQAWLIRRTLIYANHRTIHAVATKQFAGRTGAGMNVQTLWDGARSVLLETIDTFDAGRENPLETYLTWALRRHFFQTQRAEVDDLGGSFAPELWPSKRPTQVDAALASCEAVEWLSQAVDDLDPAQAAVARARFGITADPFRPAPPLEAGTVGRAEGLEPMQVSRVQRRAQRALQNAAAGAGIAGVTVDPLAIW